MHRKASLALALAVMAVSGYAVATAWLWPWKAALFPLVIGIPLLVLSAVEAAWVIFGTTERAQVQDFQISGEVAERDVLRRSAAAAAWIAGFFAAIVFAGFLVAVPLFVFLYLKLESRESWMFSAVATAAVWGFFYGLFDRLLHLPLPSGWLLAF